MRRRNFIRRYIGIWRDGLRGMTVGRTLWIIVAVKLFIMFAVLKVFFFRSPLRGLDERQRTETVLRNLTDTLRTDPEQIETNSLQ